MSLIEKYSKKELEQIVQISSSYSDIAKKLGYSSFSGDLCKQIKNFLRNNEINVSFKEKKNIERNEKNIFIENSTANQSTLRKWYLKGEYSPYKCSICNMEPVWQNKKLILILDHINGHNHDDRLENLRWVCPNCNSQLDTTNGKNRKILFKKYYCLDCGKEISKKATRCNTCASKLRIIKIEDMPITREDLKYLIRTKSFCEIGRKYNVTDNAIRKWCVKMNLPKTKRDISKYSEEEWKNI